MTNCSKLRPAHCSFLNRFLKYPCFKIFVSAPTCFDHFSFLASSLRQPTQSPPSPSLTVFAFLFWQWRRTGRYISTLTGYIMGNKHPPIRLGHGWNGCEEGKWWGGVSLFFWQVVILGGIAFIQHSGSSVREGWRLCAASLLLGEGRGGADACRL